MQETKMEGTKRTREKVDEHIYLIWEIWKQNYKPKAMNILMSEMVKKKKKESAGHSFRT